MTAPPRSPQTVIGIESTPAVRALIAVAEDALAVRSGERLPTMQDLQARLAIGSGTVRKAVRELETAGALKVRNRGHLGSVVLDRDPGLLWKLAGRPPLRLGATTPGAPDQRALLAGVLDQLDGLGVPHSVRFRRGGGRRIRQLLDGDCDLVLLSGQAALDLTPAQLRRIAVQQAPTLTYYAPGSLVLVSRAGADRARRIGIDRDSRDHAALTGAAFTRSNLTFVDCKFHLVPRAVLAGEIDAGLWHRHDVLITPELAGLTVEPLPADALAELSPETLAAALAWRADDIGLAGLVRDLDLDAAGRAQQNHIASDRHGEGDDDATWM